MTLPTAIIIGAARSGSTATFYGLASHPAVYGSPSKELNYWCRDSFGDLPAWFGEHVARNTPRTLAEYEACFVGAGPGHKVVLEASPTYCAAAPAGRIHAALPDVKIICVLRQPVEQAWSLFKTLHGGALPAFAVEWFLAEYQRPTRPYPLASHGQHAAHLEAYFRLFPRRQLHVALYDDLRARPDLFFVRLFAFLEIDWSHRVPDQRINQTGRPRLALLHKVLSGSGAAKRLARRILPAATTRKLLGLHHRLRDANLRPEPGLPPDLRAELTERYYGADLDRLARLLDRDLSHWRGGPASDQGAVQNRRAIL